MRSRVGAGASGTDGMAEGGRGGSTDGGDSGAGCGSGDRLASLVGAAESRGGAGTGASLARPRSSTASVRVAVAASARIAAMEPIAHGSHDRACSRRGATAAGTTAACDAVAWSLDGPPSNSTSAPGSTPCIAAQRSARARALRFQPPAVAIKTRKPSGSPAPVARSTSSRAAARSRARAAMNAGSCSGKRACTARRRCVARSRISSREASGATPMTSCGGASGAMPKHAWIASIIRRPPVGARVPQAVRPVSPASIPASA